jgi:lia operon protein LiaG
MKKLIFILVALFVIGLAGTLMTMGPSGGFSFNTVPIQEAKMVKSDQIKRIVVAQTSTDVHVVPSNDQNISVELKGKVSKKFKDKYNLDVIEEGEEVKISVNREDINWITSFGISIIDVDLEVQLPKKMYESITIDHSSGDMNISGIKAKEISLNVNSGDIAVEKSEAEKQFSIHSSSGDLNLKNLSAEQLQVDVKSGDTEIEHVEAKTSTLSSMSGDVKLKDVLGILDVDVTSGDTQIMNEVLTGNMTVQSTSGDVDIQFTKKPDALALDYHGSSGDGTVHLEGMLYEEKSENIIKGKIGDGGHLLEVRTNSGDFDLR